MLYVCLVLSLIDWKIVPAAFSEFLVAMTVLSSASMPSTQGYMRLDVGTSSCFATVGLGSRVRLSVSLSGDLGFENTKTSLANGELLESSHIDVF